MEKLQEQLKVLQEKRQNAKEKYTNFQKELDQVLVIESKLNAMMHKMIEKQWQKFGDMRILVLLQQSEKCILKELGEAQVACQAYENYHERLGREVLAAEATVSRARTAIDQFDHTSEVRILDIPKSRQEAAWDTSRTVVEDYAKIETVSWNACFPALWSRCGWQECRLMKSSLRKQFMCQHLVSRHFLHLNVSQLEEEKQRWHPDNFAGARRKFKELAAELIGDIEQIIKQRMGDDCYLWDQKRRQLYQEETQE